MEINDRKDHIIRCVKLGMDLQASMYAAACTEEEMDALNEDDVFLSRVKTIQHIEEMNLLEMHDTVMEIAAAKGIAAPIQWRLERMNRKRWGSGGNGEGEKDTPPVKTVVYLPDNGRDS